MGSQVRIITPLLLPSQNRITTATPNRTTRGKVPDTSFFSRPLTVTNTRRQIHLIGTLLIISFFLFHWEGASLAQGPTPVAEQPVPPSLGTSCKDFALELPIFRWTQEEGPWCWATAAATVMAFHGVTYAPCFVVDAVFRDEQQLPNGVDCCDKAQRIIWQNGCLRPGRAGAAFHSFRFDYEYRPTNESTPPMTYSEVTEELCNDRPFISTLQTPESITAHTATVYGYVVDAQGENQLYVHDPQDDSPTPWIVPYKEFFVSNPYYTHIGDYISICDTTQGNCQVSPQ